MSGENCKITCNIGLVNLLLDIWKRAAAPGAHEEQVAKFTLPGFAKISTSDVAEMRYELQKISEYDGKDGFSGERERRDAAKYLKSKHLISDSCDPSLNSITRFFKEMEQLADKTYVYRIDHCKKVDTCDGLEPKVNHRTASDCQKPPVTVCAGRSSVIEFEINETNNGSEFDAKGITVTEEIKPYAKATINENGFVDVERTPFIPLNEKK